MKVKVFELQLTLDRHEENFKSFEEKVNKFLGPVSVVNVVPFGDFGVSIWYEERNGLVPRMDGPSDIVLADAFRNLPVSLLGISCRTATALEGVNITKLGQILDKSDDEFLKYRNFGTKGLKELRDQMAKILGTQRTR